MVECDNSIIQMLKKNSGEQRMGSHSKRVAKVCEQKHSHNSFLPFLFNQIFFSESFSSFFCMQIGRVATKINLWANKLWKICSDK